MSVESTGFPGGTSGKEPNAGDMRDTGSIPGSERSPGGGHGNPLQYSCLKIQGHRSLVGCSPQDCKELDMTEATWHACTWNLQQNLEGSIHHDLHSASSGKDLMLS